MRGARPFAALERAVARRAAPVAGETLVAAVSGGPDSVALGALLARAAAAAGATVVLAHVDHGIRRGALQDEAVTLALGATLGLRVRTAALPPGRGDEARLREGRYAALAGVARAAGARRIFTGHHARDQAETVLLALLRGTGPDGLCGMAPVRALEDLELHRPLLAVEPSDLRAYCAAEHLAYALDPTNADPAYRRNALRGALEGLRAQFPHLDAAIARCAAILREERAATPRARVRASVRAAVAARAGLRDVPFERLDAIADAVERAAPGRHFVRRGVEVIVE